MVYNKTQHTLKPLRARIPASPKWFYKLTKTKINEKTN